MSESAAAEPRTFARRDVHTEEPSLAGKRILITGGTTGIGRAVAALLGSCGARTFIFGRHAPELRDALEHIRAAGGAAEGVIADQAGADDIDKVFSAVDEALGGLDVAIINAGLGSEPLSQAAEARWRYVVETNLTGAIAVAQEAAKRLEGRDGQGQIVLVGSISADAEGEGSPAYAATKGGIRSFARSLRNELAKKGVRVSLIEPGTVGTDMIEDGPAEQRARIGGHQMLRAEDIAVAIRYVVSQPPRCDVTSLRIEPRLQG
ncbi:MAG TPA: SDR family oxidoreductase [Caulobacter sp.]|nr:SDR family oxidoreductase [Caulobacter sp.]